MPRPVERRLILMGVPASAIPLTGSGSVQNLGAPIDEYQDEWAIASHSFEVLGDGSGLLTVLVERREPRAQVVLD